MKAIVYPNIGNVKLQSTPEPDLLSDHVLISTKASGICYTDIEIMKGHYGESTFPLIPGHEFAGVVIATGKDVNRYSEGDRVVVDPNRHCARCRPCKKGLTNLCHSLKAYGVTDNGGFAEYCSVSESNVFNINDMPFHLAALAEPMGCVLNGIDTIGAANINESMIIGAGPIGLLMAFALQAKGADAVKIVDINEQRLQLAGELGFEPIESHSKELIKCRRSMDLVVEATGKSSVAQSTIDYVANGGSVLLFGVCSPKSKIEISPFELFRRQINIGGSHSLNHNLIDSLSVINQFDGPISKLVSHRVPIEEIKPFFESFGQKETLKVQVIFE